ncbi:hypothetical protein CORC01_06508 [Colletotrichum orchidophilum]|uniref:Uncharacterized protein n=1 Tax=Colletotrichum orchidophilum TaxID=1209926 RepID=A0A1G4B9Q8_9PEZI|nr:uncharacterized protein CORC01_06508 [Colletotrichum orchidophilum]OHE98140.1 hypothetical protein CORC01_06508 [Colletotrichum orchidophilum]
MASSMIPPEVWLHVNHYLNWSADLAALAQVNRKFYDIFQREVYLAAVREDNADIIVKSASTGNLRTLQHALSYGADLNKVYPAEAPPRLKNWVERAGRHDSNVILSKACFATPLHLAAKHGHYDTVRWLLDQNVDTELPGRFLCQCLPVGIMGTLGQPDDVSDGVPGWTPLHLAICNRQVAVARLLLSSGASQSVRVNHSSSKFPHFNRSFYGDSSIGLDPTRYRGPMVVSALHSAAYSGTKPIITHLVRDLKTDINKRFEMIGATPLYYAIAASDLSSIVLLLSLGARPEVPFVGSTKYQTYDSALEFALVSKKTDAALQLLTQPGAAWHNPPESPIRATCISNIWHRV